jgi:hypothetical protein
MSRPCFYFVFTKTLSGVEIHSQFSFLFPPDYYFHFQIFVRNFVEHVKFYKRRLFSLNVIAFLYIGSNPLPPATQTKCIYAGTINFIFIL